MEKQQLSPEIILVCGHCDVGARIIAAELLRHATVVLVNDINSLNEKSPCLQDIEIRLTIANGLEALVPIRPATYEEMAFRNREPKNYDKFLPKPIGKQRRRK